MTGPVSTFDVSLNVTPEPIVIVVKLKMFVPDALSGGVSFEGSKVYVPGVVYVSAPSAPVEPLVKLCAANASVGAIDTNTAMPPSHEWAVNLLRD